MKYTVYISKDVCDIVNDSDYCTTKLKLRNVSRDSLEMLIALANDGVIAIAYEADIEKDE